VVPPQQATGVVPNVVGVNHQLAQDTMQAAGFYYLTEEDATGKGRLLINDRNWVVVSQQPAGGTKAPLTTKILLSSKKIGE
jgi:beta-lactam-binding protein with PASTA domain